MSANEHPIVFVHGVLGWGPEEAGFGRYWEGAHDAAPDGKKVGFASVGPISSHWDRARELFYRIQGGEVDYGRRHADHFGHDRRRGGWTVEEALYPDWSPSRPIHLVGHSQGACTIRVLQHMLSEGLFEGQPASDGWIRSITTISGVNNGSTLTYAKGFAEDDGRLSRLGTELVASLTGLTLTTSLHLAQTPLFLGKLLLHLPHVIDGYNWDLEHWGLRRREWRPFGWRLWHEPLAKFFLRVLLHGFLYGKDNAAYDLSLHGMAAWNRVLRESPETFYFAYVTVATHEFEGRQVGLDDMNPLLRSFADHMGRFSEPIDGVPGFDPEAWWPNDGGVSSVSQVEPWLGRPGVAKGGEAARDEYRRHWDGVDWPAEEPDPGIWHVMRDTFKEWDHLDVVVFPDDSEKRQRQIEFYGELMERLWGLPS